MSRVSPRVLIGVCLALFLAVTLGAPFVTRGQGSATAFWLFLVPRSVMAAVVGATLAVCGVVLQALLKNDLASPFTLGVASGATMGAAIAIRFELSVLLFGLPWLNSIVVFSLAGALATTLAIDRLAQREGAGGSRFLLAGVGVALFVAALVNALFLIDEAPRYESLLRWTLGNLQQVGGDGLKVTLPCVVLGGLGLLRVVRHLDVLTLDPDSAQALGVDVPRVRRWALLATGLATAGVVASSGPIGFVGLIVPHAVRSLTGPRHRLVLPCSALLGGAFLGLCDLAARTVTYPAELPLGVITGLIGSPVFVAMLMRRGP